MRDNRVLNRATADYIALQHKRTLLFVFRGGNGGTAIYVFGRCVFSKGWV